ncbi:MAG: C40 family peptidase [Chitinophagaceae bacterium]|nr:hypothetical protein [Chitinophagaceae bacterium]MCC6636038.1 C40 family peptidase [Chitinophagaceae bacterium]
MLNKHCTTVLFLLLFNYFASTAQNNFAIAINYTPVLNSNNFSTVFGGVNGNQIKLDKQGLIREMEFIAYPKTVFNIVKTIPQKGYNIYEITTNDYPYSNKKLYIDSRFVKLSKLKPTERVTKLPNQQDILSRMKKLEGFPYMWGGNTPNGVIEMLNLYKPKGTINQTTKNLWILKGVDCSGLIYQATDGFTPRNTSSLVNYGNAVDNIENLNASQIAKLLKPLDLIVWNGHVVVVYNETTTIESTPDGGVKTTDLTKRLQIILKDKKPVNNWNNTSGKRFVVRRWIN